MRQLIRDWMTKHPIKVSSLTTPKDALALMQQEGIRHLLVYDGDKLQGVVSDYDLNLIGKLRQKSMRDFVKNSLTVGDLMSRFPVTISGGATIADGIKILNERKIHCLPVLNSSGVVEGILSQSDLLRFALVEAQRSDFNLDTQVSEMTSNFIT